MSYKIYICVKQKSMKSGLYFVLILSVLFLVSTKEACAQQTAEVHITQDPKIPKLLALKSKMTQDNELRDGYRIQVMSYGDLNDANTILSKYKTEIGTWPGTVAYQRPNYKVWVGYFQNRLEADRALIQVQRVFPDAFVFKLKE